LCTFAISIVAKTIVETINNVTTMKRKTILTSAILALLAVGQGHADNSFVVKDSNTGKKQLEGKLSTVSRICFKDGKMEVRFADKTTRELAFTNSTVLYFEGEPTSVTQVVGEAEGLQVMYQGGFVSATGLTSPCSHLQHQRTACHEPQGLGRHTGQHRCAQQWCVYSESKQQVN
jgi:hypothetical protein